VLEDVSFYVRGNWNPDTFVRFSPDGRLLAIGSYLSRLRMWDVLENKLRWEKEIPEGVVKRIDFSPDGKIVYFAEQSIDGFVYAADTLTGEIKWRFRMADDLESGRPVSKEDPYGLYRLPGCYTLKTLENGDVLVLGIHAWGDDPMMRDLKRLSRIYRFSPEGRLKWVYPKSEPLPMTVIYMDADKKGESIVFLITKRGNQKVPFPFKEGSAVLLNGEDGEPLWHHTFTPLRPYFDEVGFWESISVSPDGARASVGLFDGRTALLDLDRHEIKQTFSFGAPILVSGVPVSASATYTHLASDHMAYFQTGQSSVPYASTMSSRVTAPPGPHPGARMLTAVGAKGKTLWRYRSGHSFQNFWTDRSGRWLLTSVLRDDERLGYDSGAMLFDTHRNGGGTAKLVYYYQVKGKTHYHADLAEDGLTFALVEVPYRDPKTDTLIGEYAVHIVR
jgi:outer membrane protein assembly factor BamB